MTPSSAIIFRRFAKTPDTCADGLSSPSGLLVAQKNFLRLSLTITLLATGLIDPSPHKASEVSEPHSMVELTFATASD
jgi:hypothetical protein